MLQPFLCLRSPFSPHLTLLFFLSKFLTQWYSDLILLQLCEVLIPPTQCGAGIPSSLKLGVMNPLNFQMQSKIQFYQGRSLDKLGPLKKKPNE